MTERSERIVVKVKKLPDGTFEATATIAAQPHRVQLKAPRCISRSRHMAISYALTEAAVAFARGGIQ